LTLIRDHDLQQAVRAQPPLVTDISSDVGSWNSRIQPCSIDLSIGNVYLPLSDDEQRVLSRSPGIALSQGETAVVETLEYLRVPRTMAGIGFPPSSVSLQGVLMTNPGHIDPGFSGRLKFTVINMGKEPYELKSGQPICTVLFFAITAPDAAYDQLNTTGMPPSLPLERLLRRLSRDFLNFTKRISDGVAKEVGKLDLRLKIAQVIVPIVTAILTAAATLWFTHYTGLADLRVKVEGVEKSVLVKELESSVRELKDRMEKLEHKVP